MQYYYKNRDEYLRVKMEFFTDFGYLGLFSASFLAATILPLSSEVVLGYLLSNDYNPVMTVSVATAGNVLIFYS